MANIKDEFINWCKQIPQKNGLGYNDDHIHKLLNRLNIINSLHNEKNSIFNVDSDNVNKIINLLKQSNDDFFKENDPKHRKGKNISVARDLYAHFLILKFDLGEEYWKNFKKLTDIKSNENYFINKSDMKNNVIKTNLSNQLIFYGAPGTGKSYKLNEEAKIFKDNIERVTFHPSLTYGTFVGSFKPYSEDGKITYKYIAGVFIRHLVKALKNENENYLLIIEEINRANTAAVFGDMFQLLDRDENGESEYKISISDELKEHLDKESVNILKNNKLYLPNNFYIWATMNNADQGVMPLDTAFKRRWDFEYMPLDLTKEDEEQLQGLKLEWNKLRKNINKKLLSLGINEDKMLGFYFLNGKALEKEDNYLKALQNKVLMYLYEDVLRHCRAKIFGNSTFANISQMGFEDIEKLFINKQNEAE